MSNEARGDMTVCPIQVTCFTAMRDLASLREAVAQLAKEFARLSALKRTDLHPAALAAYGFAEDAVRSLLPQEGQQ